MSKSVKRFLTVMLLALALACFGVAFANFSVKSYADNQMFLMKEGASVKISETYPGLRFQAKFHNSLFDDDGNLSSGYSAGVLIVEKAVLGDNEFTVQTVAAKKVDALVWKSGEEDGYRIMNAVVANIPQRAYGTDLVARAFLKDEAGEYTYSNNVVTRNAAQVASLALANGDTNADELNNYISAVNPQITFSEEVNENSVTIAKGETVTFGVTPEYLTPIVSVENDSIISVKGGVITGLASGTTNVTVTIGTVSQTVEITVVDLSNVTDYIERGQNVKLDNGIVAMAKSCGYNYLQATFKAPAGPWLNIYAAPVISNTEYNWGQNIENGKVLNPYTDMCPSTVIIDLTGITASEGYTVIALTNQNDAYVENAKFVKTAMTSEVNYANAAYIYNNTTDFADNNGAFGVQWAQNSLSFAQPYIGINVGKTEGYSADVAALGAEASGSGITGGYIHKDIIKAAKDLGFGKISITIVGNNVNNVYYWNDITSAHCDEVNMQTEGASVALGEGVKTATVICSIENFDYDNWKWNWVCLPFIDSGAYMITDIHFEVVNLNFSIAYEGGDVKTLTFAADTAIDFSKFSVSGLSQTADVVWTIDGENFDMGTKQLTVGTHTLKATAKDGVKSGYATCVLKIVPTTEIAKLITQLIDGSVEEIFKYIQVDEGADYTFDNGILKVGGTIYINNSVIATAKKAGYNYLEVVAGGDSAWLTAKQTHAEGTKVYNYYSDMGPAAFVVDLSDVTEEAGKTELISRNANFLYIYSARFVASEVTERVDFANPAYSYIGSDKSNSIFVDSFADNNGQFTYRWAQGDYSFAQPYLGINVGKTENYSSDVGGIGYSASGDLTGGYIHKDLVKAAKEAGFTKITVCAVTDGVSEIYYWNTAQEYETGLIENGKSIALGDGVKTVSIEVDITNFDYDSWSWNWVCCVPYITQGKIFITGLSFSN